MSIMHDCKHLQMKGAQPESIGEALLAGVLFVLCMCLAYVDLAALSLGR